jgi:uncharacterized protein with FMN-binding domain
MKYKKYYAIFVIVLSLIGCSMALSSITAEMPDLTQKVDGVYHGKYELPPTPVKVTLDVTVSNHQITKIELVKHSCSPIGKKAEKITVQIIQQQSLDVDTVSGATASSKAILKAVENAVE